MPFSGSLPKSRSNVDVGAADLDAGTTPRAAASRRSIGLHLRLRHAGEGRELVDHAADVADLADDRVGALVEDLAVLGDHLAVAALDALGRELDRRQRVLDLVRDAPRHVRPGRRALRLHEVGDVVDRDDIGLVLGRRRRSSTRHLHVEGALRAGAVEGRPARGRPAVPDLRPISKTRPTCGSTRRQVLAERLPRRRCASMRLGRSVDDGDRRRRDRRR